MIAARVHPWIKSVVDKRNVAFMREVRFVCDIQDPNLFVDYVFGLPMMGWARHSPLLMQRVTDAPRSERPTNEQIKCENAEVLAKTRPSRDPKVDVLAWTKTSVELDNGTVMGRYYSLADLPVGEPRLLSRFTILERHGGAQEDSCRNIDDCRARGHNADSACTSTHRPADLDLMGSMARAVAEAFPGERLAGFPSDFKSAYRQVTACPMQALGSFSCWRRFAVLCGWDVPDIKSPPPSQRFRALGAILDFSYFPDAAMLIRPAEDRIVSLKETWVEVLECGSLTPALAGKLYGKLMFLSSQYFGRLGRALLRAFSRRQHESGRRGLNPQLTMARSTSSDKALP